MEQGSDWPDYPVSPRLSVRENGRNSTQMEYKTIVVHLNDQRRAQALLAPAVNIAREHSAHLIGLSLVPPIIVAPDGFGGTPPITIEAHREAYRTG
jgi:hypothetical protein